MDPKFTVIYQTDQPALKNEHAHLLSADPYTFDQSRTDGFCTLRDMDQQIAAIKAYLRLYAATPESWHQNTPQCKDRFRLKPYDLVWHLAERYAYMGDIGQAIKTFAVYSNCCDEQRHQLVEAHIAFLKGDREAFDRYAAQPNPNRHILEQLRVNWGQTLLAAHSDRETADQWLLASRPAAKNAAVAVLQEGLPRSS